MAHHPLYVGELARRLVEHEAGGSPAPSASVAAAEAACRRLKDDLIDLLGRGGVSALMGRALNLAKRERPLLAGVTLDTESDACFTGLADAVAAGTDEEAAAAAAAVLAHLLGLLIILVGEELGMQPVHKFWPHVASSVRENDE